MIQSPKDDFHAAKDENPLHTALQNQIEALRNASNYGRQDDCLEDISETFKLLIDQNPADPLLAASLPVVIGILDEYSLTFDMRAFDALEYAEIAARRLESAGDDGLIIAVSSAAQKIAQIRGQSLTDHSLGLSAAYANKAIGAKPDAVDGNDPTQHTAHRQRNDALTQREALGGMGEVTKTYTNGLIPKV
jgi:hypothetical protein